MDRPSRLLCGDDLFRVRALSDVALSPDGHYVSVTETQLDPDTRYGRTSLLVIDTQTGVTLAPPPGPTMTRAGRWAPNGHLLAFLAESSGIAQLWLWNVPSATLARLTDEPFGVTGPCSWSPASDQLVYPAGLGQQAMPPQVATLVTGNRYKTDGREVGSPTTRSELLVLALGDGTTRMLTTMPAHYASCAWSPDGTSIAFLSDRSDDGLREDETALWVAGAHDGSLTRLTDGRGHVESPTWSPDGNWLTYIGNDDRHDTAVNRDIRVVRRDGHEARSLTSELDTSAGVCVQSDDSRGYGDACLAWHPSAGVLYSYPHGGTVELAWLDPVRPPNAEATHRAAAVAGERVILAFSTAPQSERIAFIATDPTTPGEVWLTQLDGTGERRLSHRNDSWLAELTLGCVERQPVTADDGALLDAWVTFPPEGVSKPAPVVLFVHGGPHWPAGQRFSFEHQRLAAQGYVVAVGNPRGSQGYGQEFALAIQGAWGSRDYKDILAIGHHVAQLPQTNPQRMAITGVSYGGYMVAWALSRTDLFAAGVAENPVTDLVSYALTTSDGGRSANRELGADPWDAPELYRDLSPITHVRDIRTPLLLVHGELDHNCPIGQSEELYAALRALGRDVAFLRLPGEGHSMIIDAPYGRRRERWRVLDGFLATHLGKPRPSTIDAPKGQ